MKRNLKNISVKELMEPTVFDIYTRNTVEKLFRCLIEIITENKSNSLVLIGLREAGNFQGLLNRLKYSDSKIYFYSDFLENIPELNNSEFLIIISGKFSACLYWEDMIAEIFELCQGFCSLSQPDAVKIAEHLQTVAFNENLSKDLENIKIDRRNNDKFTAVLRKLASNLESHQRDLICANAELADLHTKSLHAENLAAIGQSCATIAHELRNPLGLMDLYSKIISENISKLNREIQDTEISKSLINAASCISNALSNLDNLLTELIDFSKPVCLKLSNENLKEALSEVINFSKLSYADKDVNLFLDYSIDDSFSIKFDKFKLNQVILNVLKNALEASKARDMVEVSVTKNSYENLVHINIKDNGAGIQAQDRNKIFTPYFTTKNKGSGLGLSYSKKIMEAHGGDLIISSTGSDGTSFTMLLPT